MKRALFALLLIFCILTVAGAQQQGPEWPPSSDQLFRDIGLLYEQINALQKYIGTLQATIAAQQKQIEALTNGKTGQPDNPPAAIPGK